VYYENGLPKEQRKSTLMLYLFYNEFLGISGNYSAIEI